MWRKLGFTLVCWTDEDGNTGYHTENGTIFLQGWVEIDNDTINRAVEATKSWDWVETCKCYKAGINNYYIAEIKVKEE